MSAVLPATLPVTGRPRQRLAAALACVLLASFGVCLYAIVPLKAVVPLVGVVGWMFLPGVIIARRLYAPQRSAWWPALLVGAPWGFAASSAALLAMWVAGVRNPWALLLAPVAPMLLAPLAGRLAGSFETPAFDRRDLAPLCLVLLLVPLVVGRPFSRVGEMRPEGKAYRAYFIADFEWAMSVASELSKGDVPPKNPFLAGDTMHYYWLADLISGVEHRVSRQTLALEPILLCNAMLLDCGFIAFLYFFVRQFVHSPSAAAAGCIAAVLFSSFEGIERIYFYWQNGIPFDALRNQNIDAISNWVYGALKIDGLHRVLLYQAQHATAWALSLSSLLLLVQARENGKVAVNLAAGTLLGLSLLISPFIAVMVGSVVAAYQILTLASRGAWRDLVLGGIAGAVPAGAAVLVTGALGYVDRSGGPVVFVGHLNPVAAHSILIGTVLSFGPMLIAATAGAAAAVWRRDRRFAVLALVVAVSVVFYFFVDVVDHQHAYVGWRAGHLLFIAFAPLAGFAAQELWRAGGAVRVAAAVVASLVVLAAAPMTAIDLYNTQDTDNQSAGPGFKWTEIITPDELQALGWIKTNLPLDALVQPDPIRGPGSGTWAYMPAFGERRVTAGVPISMIPVQKYKDAAARVEQVFAATSASTAYAQARVLGLEYVYVGPEEERVYPKLRGLLDAAPFWFTPVFHNDSVSLYFVARPPA